MRKRLPGTPMFEYQRSDNIIQKTADWITKRVFLDAFIASDEVAWQRDDAAHAWCALGRCVEYSKAFVAIANDARPPVYLAMFKAAVGFRLRRVTVKIKVKQAGVIHEQCITLDDLGRRPVRKALDEIPLKPKRATSKQGTKLGDVYLKLVSAIDEDGVELVQGRKVATIFSPICTVSSLHQYAVRWGQYWNVDEIERAKQLEKNRLYQCLVQSAGQLWRPLRLRRLAFYGLTNPVALSLAFWSRNLVAARELRALLAGQQQLTSMRPVASPHTAFPPAKS